jgi:hypothetical protein
MDSSRRQQALPEKIPAKTSDHPTFITAQAAFFLSAGNSGSTATCRSRRYFFGVARHNNADPPAGRKLHSWLYDQSRGTAETFYSLLFGPFRPPIIPKHDWHKRCC